MLADLLLVVHIYLKYIRKWAAAVESAEPVIDKVRKAGIKVRFSLVQAHSVPSEKLAENARKVAGYGAQCITIMDSTGVRLFNAS